MRKNFRNEPLGTKIFICIFDIVEYTSTRQNASKLAFALAYTYICHSHNRTMNVKITYGRYRIAELFGGGENRPYHPLTVHSSTPKRYTAADPAPTTAPAGASCIYMRHISIVASSYETTLLSYFSTGSGSRLSHKITYQPK